MVLERRRSLRWSLFALSAFVATAVSVLVVKLVLRGPPELHLVSLVTAASADSGHSAVVRSRFGLYIPRDGDQRIQLQNTSTDAVSTINAFAIHPAHLVAESAMPSPQEYMVPVRDLSGTDPPAI